MRDEASLCREVTISSWVAHLPSAQVHLQVGPQAGPDTLVGASWAFERLCVSLPARLSLGPVLDAITFPEAQALTLMQPVEPSNGTSGANAVTPPNSGLAPIATPVSAMPLACPYPPSVLLAALVPFAPSSQHVTTTRGSTSAATRISKDVWEFEELCKRPLMAPLLFLPPR
jgi:hypothetical protein